MTWTSLEHLSDELDRLGLPWALYKPGLTDIVLRFLSAFFLAVASCVLIGLAFTHALPASLFLAGGGVLALGAAGYLFERTLRRRHLRVLLFEEALLRVERDRYLMFCWDDIALVWHKVEKHYVHGVAVSTTHTYTVTHTDGTNMVFASEVADTGKLGQHIQEEVTRRRLPRALERYDAGETVVFGRLGVSEAGLSDRNVMLPWAEVKSVAEEDDVVVIRKHGKWFAWSKVATSEVPNLAVFLALVREVMDGRA